MASSTGMKNILITGATGKQGGATLAALVKHQESLPRPRFNIFALSRDISSPSAKPLAALPNVSLVQGNLSESSSIFKSVGAPVWGAYLVQTLGHEEEAQGKAFIDAAMAAKVKHLVFSSVDRGNGQPPTNVPHFASKYGIEQHLFSKAPQAGLTWTILRPVAFLDNYTNDFFGRVFGAIWRQLGDKPFSLIATRDIGFWGAKSFYESDTWGKDRDIPLSGTALTFDEANKIFKEETGKDMPATFGFVSTAVKTLSKEFGTMTKFFADPGFSDIDSDALRKENPDLQSFGTWIKQSSPYRSWA